MITALGHDFQAVYDFYCIFFCEVGEVGFFALALAEACEAAWIGVHAEKCGELVDFPDLAGGGFVAGNRLWAALISVRELAASLCAESRQLMLADGLFLYCRTKMEEASPAESLRTVGDQANPAYALVSDEVQIVNRMEDIANSIGCYYRRNYLTGDYRAVIEGKDQGSVDLYRLRRATPNLDWHQSSRGYVGGLEDQKSRLRWLTDYMLTVSARKWDYATFELPASAVEDLQRYDVVTLNRPRSGYYSAIGRVVALQRMSGPLRWQVTAQMSGATTDAGAFVWQSNQPWTYIKLAESGSRMDFVCSNVLVAQLTSAGDFRLRGHFYVNAGQILAGTQNKDGIVLPCYRIWREGGGNWDMLFSIDGFGNLSLRGFWTGAMGVTKNVVAPAVLGSGGGVAGMVDTATSSARGRLEFYLVNRLVMYVDDSGMCVRGKVVTNLGNRLGSGL